MVGIIFVIIKLIHNVLRCPKYDDGMYGKETLDEHICHVLHNVIPIREYDWVLPQLELLHLEMQLFCFYDGASMQRTRFYF